MEIDLELYRREVRVATQPMVRLSAIDLAPDYPRRTLVFIHGFGGQALQWVYQIQHFALDNRCIALDLRGHGRSDRPSSPYTMAECQADLDQALNLLAVAEPCVLVGHSFGGAVAAEFAAAHPERVERLVLIATAGEFRLSPLFRTLLGLPLTLLRPLQPFTRHLVHAPFHVLKAWYRNNLSSWNGWSTFRSVAVPTLVIQGHWDLLFEKPLFAEVARAIPGADNVDVGTSGHMVMLERRDAVNRAMERFMAGETTRTWRQPTHEPQATGRSTLRSARPWLASYDANVPYTIAVPQIPLQQLLRSAVRRFPRHTALIYAGQQISYRALNQAVNRFANALCTLGLTPGQRVLLLLPNLPEAVIGFYAILKAGGVVVFTSPQTEAAELIAQVRSTESQILLAPAHQEPLARTVQEATGLAHLVLVGPQQSAERSAAGQVHSFTELSADQSPQSPAIDVDPSSLAVIQYTGGTTGTPKGVMLSHRNLVANTLQTRHWMPSAAEGREIFLSVLPFSHSYGLTTALNLPVALGATLILKPTFDLVEILQAIKQYRPTLFPGVPNMYLAINNFPRVRKYGIDSIKACISGSAPLPMEVQEAFEKLTRGRLVEGYGLTEAGPVTHANPLNNLRKVGSIGIPVPSTDAHIVDLTTGTRVVASGQIGELAVRGPQVMLGYWQDPAATAQVLSADGWLRTGDVAQMDEEGYFRLIARKADIWYPDRQAPPAFPRDIEEVLYEIPQVKECTVVAIANQPIAFVTAREELAAETVIAYCRRRLPPELVPRFVLFVEEFPRTFIGKVLRRELARRYTQRREPDRPAPATPISASEP